MKFRLKAPKPFKREKYLMRHYRLPKKQSAQGDYVLSYRARTFTYGKLSLKHLIIQCFPHQKRFEISKVQISKYANTKEKDPKLEYNTKL